MPWTWARFLIVTAYAAPAAIAGYSAPHCIAQVMPSPTWQMIFSIIGAIVVGITALVQSVARHSLGTHTGPNVVPVVRRQHGRHGPTANRSANGTRPEDQD